MRLARHTFPRQAQSVRGHWLVWLLLCAVAARAEFLPALRIEEVQIAEPRGYTQLVAQTNEAMRTRHQVLLFLRAYVATTLTGETRSAFTLSPAGSFEILQKNGATFSADPDLADLREKLRLAGPVTSSTHLKAVRFDGTNTPGWLFNTLVKTSDEPALLSRVAELATRLGQPGRPPPKLNVFRVVAGHSTYTHLVSLNEASESDLATRLDAIAAAGWTPEFSAPSGESCVIVQSTIYREMLP